MNGHNEIFDLIFKKNSWFLAILQGSTYFQPSLRSVVV